MSLDKAWAMRVLVAVAVSGILASQLPLGEGRALGAGGQLLMTTDSYLDIRGGRESSGGMDRTLVAGGLVLAGAAQGGWKSALPSTVEDQDATALSTLLTASAEEIFPKGERVTLFLPEMLPPDESALLLAPAHTSERREYLKRHTLKGAQTIQSLGALPEGSCLEFLDGTKRILHNATAQWTLDGVPLVQSDLTTRNGWLHPIGYSLPPEHQDLGNE